jgi:hypothetical protein
MVKSGIASIKLCRYGNHVRWSRSAAYDERATPNSQRPTNALESFSDTCIIVVHAVILPTTTRHVMACDCRVKDHDPRICCTMRQGGVAMSCIVRKLPSQEGVYAQYYCNLQDDCNQASKITINRANGVRQKVGTSSIGIFNVSFVSACSALGSALGTAPMTHATRCMRSFIDFHSSMPVFVFC